MQENFWFVDLEKAFDWVKSEEGCPRIISKLDYVTA